MIRMLFLLNMYVCIKWKNAHWKEQGTPTTVESIQASISNLGTVTEFSDRNDLLSRSVFKNNQRTDLYDISYVCHKHIHERM